MQQPPGKHNCPDCYQRMLEQQRAQVDRELRNYRGPDNNR